MMGRCVKVWGLPGAALFRLNYGGVSSIISFWGIVIYRMERAEFAWGCFPPSRLVSVKPMRASVLQKDATDRGQGRKGAEQGQEQALRWTGTTLFKAFGKPAGSGRQNFPSAFACQQQSSSIKQYSRSPAYRLSALCCVQRLTLDA